MKSLLSGLFVLFSLFMVFYGKDVVSAIFEEKSPTPRAVILPSTNPSLIVPKAAPKRITGEPNEVMVKIAVPGIPNAAIGKPIRNEPDLRETDPEGTQIFDSLKIKRKDKLEIPAYSSGLETKVPASLKLVRAQPSVYKILTYGDIEMRIPDKVMIDVAALLQAYKQNGGEPGPDRANDPALTKFFWFKLTQDPSQYLSFESEQAAQKFENELMSSGTGFLISRNGIVLTNAHVIGDMDDQPLTQDPFVLANLIGSACDDFIKSAIKQFGGEPAPELAPEVATNLLKWFAANGKMTGKFKRAELVLQFKKKDFSTVEALTGDLDELFARPPVPIVCPLEVLLKGEELPGKDVAILRAKPTRANGDFDPIDTAICLPLGDSEDVLAGTRVQALGFPGIAFNEHIMTQEAAYRVSAQDGQVANTKPMTGGYEAIEMTADINHGDSGGPVVNVSDGLVIGLNVGAAQENATGHTLAIPINVAKEMLDTLDVEIDPGPATALWIDALKQYDAKRYQESADILARLIRLQAGWTTLDGTMLKDISGNMVPNWSSSVNPYLVDLMKRATAKAK